MILPVFVALFSILVVLLFFNFFAKANVTRSGFGVLGGIFSLLLGVNLLVTGLTFATGQIEDLDKTEDVDGNFTTINATTVITTVYESQNTALFDYGFILGIFFLMLGMFVFLGNVINLIPR